MSNFINDNTSLPTPKTDLVPLGTLDGTKRVTAADWNTVCQALYDTRAAHLGLTSSIYGDGSDGSPTFDGIATINLPDGLTLVPSANVYKLPRNVYFNIVTINAGITLRTSSDVGNFIYRAKQTLGAGTLDASGANAVGTTGGAGTAIGTLPGTIAGVDAAASNGTGGSNGISVPRGYAGTGGASGAFPSGAGAIGGIGAGGGGGSSAAQQGGTGGAAGTAFPVTAGDIGRADEALIGAVDGTAARTYVGTARTGGNGGGGGGDGFSGGYGGASGASGAYMAVASGYWQSTITIKNNGGNGSNGTAARNSGGGGGGGGGFTALVMGGASPMPITSNLGGTGGAGSTGGAAGGNGGPGVLRVYVVGR